MSRTIYGSEADVNRRTKSVCELTLDIFQEITPQRKMSRVNSASKLMFALLIPAYAGRKEANISLGFI